MARDKTENHNRLKNFAVTFVALGGTTLICVLLRTMGNTESYVPLMYVLCVLLVSRFTDGYVCGIIAAVTAVLGVNYVFTYPYMAFNFTISGYPVTFAIMLAVSISTSALMTRIKLEEKLKLESERERLRADLFRSVSHDLRTPLTSISGSVNAVLAEPEMPEAKRCELLTGVRNDADWLIRMVENLLSITRMGSEAHIEKDPEAVEEIVAEAAVKFRKRFPNVSLSVSAPDEVLFVPMDAVLIEQVLANLLENAVIHGAKTTEISMGVCAKAGRAVFSVCDNGVGISPSAISRLFVDYMDESRRTTGAGEKRNMGIGLSVCMTIVKAHGGEIHADNLPGGGACFSFWLPTEYTAPPAQA